VSPKPLRSDGIGRMSDIHEPREIPGTSWITPPGYVIRRKPEAWVSPGVEAAKSAEPGDWLKDRLYPISRSTGTRVCSVIPDAFAAYARVLHPARNGSEGQVAVRWRDVASWSGRITHPEMQWETISQPRTVGESAPPWRYEPAVGYCAPDVLAPLVDILRKHSIGEDGCWACVWEGWGGIGDAFPEVSRVNLPGRNYMLFWVPFALLAEGVFRGPGATRISPSLWWFADRSWCVATEVDFAWTYVGGSRSCIEDILSHSNLEAMATAPHHRGDHESDQINIVP
jgi:hypothetical protein